MGVMLAGDEAQRGFRVDPALRGYQVLFRQNESNHCPGCGRAQWYVGRITAECVFCATALPLAEAHWGESSARARAYGPADCDEPLKEIDWSDRRGHERRPSEGRILQLLVGGSAHPFAVHNISSDGLMGDTTADLVATDRVEVLFESGAVVQATIRWTDGIVSGLAFADPVDPEFTRSDPAA